MTSVISFVMVDYIRKDILMYDFGYLNEDCAAAAIKHT